MVVRMQTLRVAWTGLAIAAVSGVIWVLLQAAAMSGLPFGEAMTADVLLTVVNETQFGLVSEIRFALAVILAACLACAHVSLARWSALASALGLVAAISWTGHAGSTVGTTGLLHLAADVLHLLASAAWIGGLVPLALLLNMTRRNRDASSSLLACDATRRFSALGLVSVNTVFATGVVNAWILIGSFHALLVTEYGRLLMFKIALFAVMLTVAAVNRFWLTPRLALVSASNPQPDVLRQLTRNSIAEIALGLMVFGIVGALGTLHPAIHLAGGPILSVKSKACAIRSATRPPSISASMMSATPNTHCSTRSRGEPMWRMSG